ncbi:MAG TPA: SDR family oxidoreductase [Acidimicrobiales bacterium]|nr:SDR family oxidoreductase [Acidimicrobiales bacterium]
MTTLAEYRSLFDLSGKKAVVIGAGSGIGEAAAQALAAHGADVLCADLNADRAAEVARAIVAQGGHATSAAADITDADSVEALFAGDGDDIEIMVCTPSINVRKRLLDMTEEEFSRVVDLNLKGTFNALRVAGRHMADQGRGSIVVLSSVRSQTVEPGQGVYAATKAGTLLMVKTLAAELGPMGVRVNAVGPGVVETPLTAPIKADPDWYRAYSDISALGRWSSPEEQTGAIVYLASDAASFVTGTILFVDGGWTAVDGRFEPPL